MNWSRIVFGLAITGATYLTDVGLASAMSSTTSDDIAQAAWVGQVIDRDTVTPRSA